MRKKGATRDTDRQTDSQTDGHVCQHIMADTHVSIVARRQAGHTYHTLCQAGPIDLWWHFATLPEERKRDSEKDGHSHRAIGYEKGQ
mmetsp:Transcript_53646/g.134939  ORF Transcript_53646/g.134939 Transcript_53646/m.134939 type:complete len:87 (+) Transcript_53646:100-360(+)